ncbi:MAG: DEAD/DEAH box helicase, partial [Planctomycetaceae bacterium]
VNEAQKWMEVHLPEGGEERPVRLQPTLLLQMRGDGALDSSMCMADAGGNLHYPATGVRRIGLTTVSGGGAAGDEGAVSGEPVGGTLVRDLSWEEREGRRLAAELGLSGGQQLRDWVWRHVESEEVRRIVQAGAALHGGGALRVLWHRQSTVRMELLGRMTAQNVKVRVQRKRDWFGLDGVVNLAGREVSLREILPALSSEPVNGLMEVLPGQWAEVEGEILRLLRRLHDVALDGRGGLQLDPSAAPAVAELEAASVEVSMDRQWQQCLQRLKDSRELEAELPADFLGELRDYQLQGYRWLSRLAAWGIGCVLADDMGLGKTVQALAILMARAAGGPALIVAPTSLGFNWQRECERFAPGLRAVQYRESDRASLLEGVGAGDVVICSYGLALRDVERLERREWHTLVLDEAQNVKNSNSKTAGAVRQLRANWRVALTGTPMENHLGELWSIFHVVAPGVLGSWEQFRCRFAQPIEREDNRERREALSRVIGPFLLRRAKRDVLLELPERTEVNLLVELSAAERERYEQARRSALDQLETLAEGEGDGGGGGGGGEVVGNDKRLQVLALLLKLRQLSCHVKLVDGSWSQGSSKLQLLREKLLELRERGHRALVFSQFVSHLELIRRECEDAGVTYQYLDGSTPAARRQELVESFQGGEGDVFLISLKAGGTGLNLTGADYVIHMDPWWNPAVEDQATDRAHRMGQRRPVVVYRLIAKETVEEQILSLHEEKRDLVDSVLSGADVAGRLTAQDLANLIRQGG